MSESIVRKVQPFTIGTRLSVPAVPKCQEFTESYLQSQSLDNCTLQHNLNSLYLSRSQVCAHGPCLVSPIVKQVAPVKQEDMAAEDHLNQNVASPSAVSRSIKKIAISGNKDRSEDKVSVGPAQLSITGSTSENNNNNNNVTSTSDPHLPRIVGVSCENKPSSHFKVLLRKDSSDEFQSTQGQTRLKLHGDKPVQQVSMPESQKKESHVRTQNEACAAVTSQIDCFTQRNSLFNKEVLQAEAWIKGKLQDLKDGCNIQRCPLQDWEEASQTLQRDLKDFENTLIQLNQMGEQLICKMNPTSDLVKKQLSQLRDQWQTLKQTAANQTRALGGAKNLQEFNKKVDKLEAWIKEKQEEEQSLVNVLEENVDKMQLTRRILDLKQDEQLYRNLHEEINHLALKLEKQGKTDGKNISSRRKHINKMWLKVQSHLKNYHENLQLALEVSSFYQQADNTLFAINNMRKSMSASKELDSFGDREIRDIASQIMMLDVSVSQLSNLHPALAAGVTQKQSEVKDCWALLQKIFRSDRTTLSPTGSTFTREDADPLTPAREPECNVGMETQRIMGKEVKEEQNRLKGCVSTVECGVGRRTPGNQSQEQQSVNHTSLPMGDGPACAHDVIVRHQLKGESRKPRAEPKLAAAPRGHPQLHVQLQKFTVSADKTLSWLKDNVSMATQVCSVASFEGLEAARRCQHALEQEILTNRARIEVVKREGRGLVRAQHPGSAKIEEFLGQLEVLWEELRRRHQRNAMFLQASEELGFRVVKVLQALGSLEAWLESVELSMKESALAGDPETMSMAERESCLLEKEVAARSLELRALRQEVDRLHDHSHPHTRGLPARIGEVERKYHRVQSALTQQNSELQDTRMLTEFLERVELEESQELSGNQYSLGQPLHSEISSAPTLLGLQSSSGGEPLIESMGDPVEELREAVEMLNDTVRERGRSQSHDQAIQELLSKHASLAVRVEECLCCSKELSLDILEKETDMAVQCEPDRCGLETLQEMQDHLEIDYEVIREEVKELENQASRLEELCPERVHILGAKIQAMLQGWTELGKSVTENKARLREFVQLQDFFRSYLAMISWTEDTRSCIFSDTALHLGKDGQRPLAAELDMQIEQKFEEFDELVATGRNLLDKDHHLTQMVKERMEELRSMLGWILVHWRAQKQQWLHKKSRQESSQDNIYSEATMCSTITESSAPELEAYMSHQSPVVTSANEDKLKATGDSRRSSLPLRQAEQEQEEKQLEDGYEVMNSIGPRSGEATSSESPRPSIVLLKKPGSPALGGTVNLILSFGNTGDSQVQVLDSPARTDEVVEETSEPVHRPTVPQTSACKNFWRRCQGLLENTLGSLKRKRKIYQQSANEDQSMSLLSVHMGLDGVCQQRKAAPSLDDMENQEGSVATGGRCITLSGKPELQSMEGTLERKHKLQLGGKKAASRGWNSYHAVLYRHTLCFYQDRKDTLRSSACGLPLNLMAAECSPAPEYTKKPNCFRLRLRDGSEYLLNASSRFMMKKWMMKIQANTGQSESVSSLSSVPFDQDFPISLKPTLCSTCHGLAKCHCSSRHDVTSTFPRRKAPGAAQTKEIVVLTREFTHMSQSHLRSVDEQSTISSTDGGCCDDDEVSLKQTVTHRLSGASSDNMSSSPHSPVSSDHDWFSNKRRSHSFTSATFQKIKPMPNTPGGRGLERGSNYCVTLVVGDKSSDSPSVSRSSEPPLLALAGWQQDSYQDSALRSYASLPRQRNKSVFKKFFGKRDL
ncbi:spectrin alpha chain, non-erythrocytic 1 isoform X5 [Larimichthys crocea]|uniref:spectrin alpha chain, non-erythrocytic 1 isoform X5 n=1 Tax=Larimichthys crocea TaxID=215358 RepID=UPI000F5D8BBA|nr:spectrin alpha chain, non-erythrocytic 1 isoform X5 [Larimichthys crocea]